MKRKRYTEEQIIYALKQAEAGVKASEICRTMGVSEQTFYTWKRKYSLLSFYFVFPVEININFPLRIHP